MSRLRISPHGGASLGQTRVVRPHAYADPPPAVTREVLSAAPDGVLPAPSAPRPPVLLVPGLGYGAWMYAEHWLEHVAGRGFPAYAMSVRGHGASGTAGRADLRAYAHDVAQVAAGLPRQAVIVGHGAGAAVVALTLAQYSARAAVLVAPVFGGFAASAALAASHPVGALRLLLRGSVRLGGRRRFDRGLDPALAREYLSRLLVPSGRVRWQLVRGVRPERPAGDPPVLVLGSSDDRVAPRAALDRVARRYGGAPLLFPGAGHDLPLDIGWRAPAEAICDWLDALPER